jgi:hypothetical protein
MNKIDEILDELAETSYNNGVSSVFRPALYDREELVKNAKRELCEGLIIYGSNGAPEEVDGQPVTYMSAEGEIAGKSIHSREIRETGEIIFFELIGASIGKDVFVDGKKKYKRLFIRRVWPHVVVESEERMSEKSKEKEENAI